MNQPIATGRFGVIDADKINQAFKAASIKMNKTNIKKWSRKYILGKEWLDPTKSWTIKKKIFSPLSYTYKIWPRQKRKTRIKSLNNFYADQMSL